MERAGNRRHQVQVQAPADEQDALGAPTRRWKTLFSTLVGITPLSGRELLAAQAAHAEASHQISGVYRPEWRNPTRAASYRIVYGNRIFNIHSVQNVEERGRDVLIVASEGMNEG
jgi:head-tail adaptor